VASGALAKKRGVARPPGVQLGADVASGMILAGGALTFAELGLRATSVENILKASNVSRRTFYQHFSGKEDVALVLYKIGTRRLVEACKRAMTEETEALRQCERCIDAHLESYEGFGRLVFVLGGDAQRPESPLHARRLWAHREMGALFATALRGALGKHVDPFIVRTLVLALEAIPRMLFEETDDGRTFDRAAVARARRVMRRIVTSVAYASGPGISPLPLLK
jgi:AcrR family transcriptional regulator